LLLQKFVLFVVELKEKFDLVIWVEELIHPVRLELQLKMKILEGRKMKKTKRGRDGDFERGRRGESEGR